MTVREILVGLACGVLFGVGLAVSQMINPAKVLGFLDVAGDWDPSLALVLASAVAVSTLAFRAIGRRPRPLFAARFDLPTRKDVDARLVSGTAVFGVGWGLVGFCPGPALAALALGRWQPTVFVAAMLAGMALYRVSTGRAAGGAPPASTRPAD